MPNTEQIPTGETYNFNIAITFGMLAFFALCASVFAGFIGYGKQGFNIETVFRQFTAYSAPASLAIVALLVLFIAETIYLKKGDSLYGNFLFFNSPGEGPSILTKTFKNPIKLFLLSLIVCVIISSFLSFYGQTYFGVGHLEQQFTQIDGIAYNWFLVVTSENMQAAAFAALLIFCLRIFARKNQWSRSDFLIISSIIVLLSFVFFGYINHLLRYSGQEQSMIKVVGFWFLLGALTIITGSFIPAFVMHGTNNTFAEIPTLAKDVGMIYVIAFVVILAVIYYFLFMRRNKA